MKHVKCKSYVFFSLLILLFVACTKTGPAGNQGAQGPQGTPGVQGPAGTANVQYSSWIPASWISSTVYPNTATSLVPAPGISQLIIDEGMVLVYMKPIPSATSIFPLPKLIYSISGVTSVPKYTIDFYLQPGDIVVFNETPLVGNTGAADDFPDAEFRYIILPPGVPAPSDISYEKVCAQFKIEN